ncbi:hypothetical protein B0T22DRAFT_305239 [Podospora appendiculata]|uniref:Uncharacterized protein n=1 Tax=Podospora appendiculata TaxID=314037 RepID=A0AAE0WZM9_9PEZI|nr:hypothetical protein B0T22DRAFT_305239 [Podospora appendiculata]
MAFHQPTRHLQQQRTNRVHSEDGDSVVHAPQVRRGTNESQTWVLFTPGTDAGTTTSYLTSSQGDQEQATPGRSRISLLGSLDGAARSDFNSRPDNSAVPSDFLEESITEEDAELDSLDSHLPDFRTIPNPYGGDAHAAPVLPGHDGLGSFRFEAQGMGADAQDRLYAFEKFNPQRVQHRVESLELIRMELDNEEVQELDRNQRIEAWRLEQSQLLLDDIRRETKRRQSEASVHKLAPARRTVDGPTATSNTENKAASDAQFEGSDWHDQDEPKPTNTGDGLWSRITRKVLCDLMGIDDRLLAILFGEALPDEADSSLSSTPKASAMSPSTPAFAHMGSESESSHDSTWQLHMLERIARELGMLVHSMTTHPGAFSAYTRMQQMPLPYAGLPVIPESSADLAEAPDKTNDSILSMPQFKPTVTKPVDIRGARPSESSTPGAPSVGDVAAAAINSSAPPTFSQHEWEQELDIKLVFRYLRSRFTSPHPSSSPPFTSGTSHLATSSTQDAAAKAARIRQHHPLVSHAHAHAHSHGHHRPRPVERRSFKTASASPVALRHPSGSCASQSTRRSARRSSVSSRHSSRHYWDIGGSIGTGSMVASTGPMGSWGEV